MTVEQQQLLLAYLGYYDLRRRDGSLAIDGISGAYLQRAIKGFQEAHGIVPSGNFGSPTEKAVLKAIAEGERVTNSPPPPVPSLSWPGKHFTRSEFACKCGGKYCNGFPVEPDNDLVRLLDRIREYFGQPVTITSGIRCARHNANVGGVSNSKHLYGLAADIVVRGVSPSKVAEYVETLMPNSGGIGRYNSFTHVDVRKSKSRWRG